VMAAPTAEDVHEAFRFFDMDKDQKLSKSEFKILSQSLGQTPTQIIIDALWMKLHLLSKGASEAEVDTLFKGKHPNEPWNGELDVNVLTTYQAAHATYLTEDSIKAFDESKFEGEGDPIKVDEAQCNDFLRVIAPFNNTPAKVLEALQVHSLQNDGHIAQDDFKYMMSSLGETLKPGECRKALNEALAVAPDERGVSGNSTGGDPGDSVAKINIPKYCDYLCQV